MARTVRESSTTRMVADMSGLLRGGGLLQIDGAAEVPEPAEQPAHPLRVAEDEDAAVGDVLGQPPEHALLRRPVEVHEDVAAEHGIEARPDRLAAAAEPGLVDE